MKNNKIRVDEKKSGDVIVFILNGIPYVLLHFWVLSKIIGLFCTSCPMPKSERFRHIQVFISKIKYGALQLLPILPINKLFLFNVNEFIIEKDVF